MGLSTSRALLVHHLLSILLAHILAYRHNVKWMNGRDIVTTTSTVMEEESAKGDERETVHIEVGDDIAVQVTVRLRAR